MKKSISILKETLTNEKRIILLPNHIKKFVDSGYDVFVENNAGAEIGLMNQQYEHNGAIIVDTEQAWNCSDLIIKYKAPTEDEYKYLRRGMTVSAIFHAEGNRTLIEKLCEKGITAYSYEFFETDDGYFPLAMSGGEIAGKIADRDNDESDLKNQDNNSIDNNSIDDNTNNDTNNNEGSNHIIIQTSMKDDTGLDILIDSIKKLFINGKIEYNNEANITNIRHKEALSDAFESLKLVKQSLADEMPEDFLSIDLMNAYTSLGKIIGEEVEDDLVNEIFSKFCMGK